MKALSIHSILIPSDHSRFNKDGPPDLAAQIQAVVPGFARLPASVIDQDVLIIQDKLPLKPTRRLVVLVPPGEVDETALARRVWQLAASSGLDILYLALSWDDAQTPYQRRRLAGMAALTCGQDVRAHACVSAEKDWRQALKRTLQAGDLLVCLASHKVPKYLVWRTPLGKQLARTAGVPVYLFEGFKIGPTLQVRQALREALAWIISIFLMAAFFGVQAGIDRFAAEPLSTIGLFLTVVVEVYLLFKVNEWIG
jgi:hypothetical protein